MNVGSNPSMTVEEVISLNVKGVIGLCKKLYCSLLHLMFEGHITRAIWEWRGSVVQDWIFAMDMVNLMLALGHCCAILMHPWAPLAIRWACCSLFCYTCVLSSSCYNLPCPSLSWAPPWIFLWHSTCNVSWVSIVGNVSLRYFSCSICKLCGNKCFSFFIHKFPDFFEDEKIFT